MTPPKSWYARPGTSGNGRRSRRGRRVRTVVIGLAALILLSVAVADTATNRRRIDGAVSAQDVEFVGHAHGYRLTDEYPDELATVDGRRFCSDLAYQYWGPGGAFQPEWGHLRYIGRYRDMRAIWLAATRTYCPQFQRSVHGAYEARGKPVYSGGFDGGSGRPLPYDYPEGGLCLSRYNSSAGPDWPGYPEGCPPVTIR